MRNTPVPARGYGVDRAGGSLSSYGGEIMHTTFATRLSTDNQGRWPQYAAQGHHKTYCMRLGPGSTYQGATRSGGRYV